jgi:hypothetical protein
MSQKTILLVMLAGALILWLLMGTNESSQTSDTGESAYAVDEWHVGGTLHNSKITEWETATNKNKLATCADFMAKVDNSVSMDVLKKRAQALQICIDEATVDLDNPNNYEVSAIAALCIPMMGY